MKVLLLWFRWPMLVLNTNKGIGFNVVGFNVWCRNPSLGLATKAREPNKKPRSEGKCEGMNLHTPKGASIVRIGVWWTHKSSKSDCKGQNPMDWRFLYTIGKLLDVHV
jgi:hypothetical protein